MEEDQSCLHSNTQALIPLPAYPYKSVPLSRPARGHLPPPGRADPPEAAGTQAALQSLCRSCRCAWESKGQGEVPRVPRCPTVAPATWNLRCLRYVHPHRGAGTKGIFRWLEITRAAAPVSHSNSHHGLLLNHFHLCSPLLPSSVPSHAAEVHCWPLYVI